MIGRTDRLHTHDSKAETLVDASHAGRAVLPLNAGVEAETLPSSSFTLLSLGNVKEVRLVSDRNIMYLPPTPPLLSLNTYLSNVLLAGEHPEGRIEREKLGGCESVKEGSFLPVSN
jgi:hypothetical protein